MSCIGFLWLRCHSSCMERCSFKGGQKQKPSVASALCREEWNMWGTNSPVASDAAESSQRGTCSGLCCSLWANPELLPPWVHLGLQTLHHVLEAPPRTCVPKQGVRPGACWPLHEGRPTSAILMPWSRPQPFLPLCTFLITGLLTPEDSDGPQALPFEQAQGNPGLMPTMLAAGAGTHKGWQVAQSASRVTNNTGGLLAGAGPARKASNMHCALPTSQTAVPRSQSSARPVPTLPPKSM